MTKHAAALILLGGLALLLVACGGAVYVPSQVTPVVRNISPQEAAGIVIDATNTAAAVGTQNAIGTAVEQSARSTSTTAARLTQDSMMVMETQSALSLTQGAGQALATNAAAVHTADADQTAAAAPATAAALRVAVAATGTQLARQAETAVRRQSLDDQIAAAWRWVGVVVFGLGGLGIAGALTFGLSDILSARAELQRAAARRAEAEAAQLWVMQYGSRLFQLRGNNVWEEIQTPQLAAPASMPVVDQPSAIREVPVRAHGEVVSSIPVGVPETPERLRVLHLVDQAISIAGPNAAFVPAADRLGMYRQEWQDAVDVLKAGPDRPAYVMTSPGRPKAGQLGRTRLCQPAYMTLGALRDGIKRGEIIPPPPPPKPEPAP